MPRIATIDDGAAKHVVRQGIRPSPGAGVVCVGFVVTEVGVAVIVRVQSAELSSVQRFVLRLIGDWGAGSERIGGIALLGCPLPRPRRRSTTTADLLIWTPYGCTLVLLADFGSVQHGALDTPSAGRWCVGERAADLRTGSGAVNPLQRARRQRAELAAIFGRAGVPDRIDVLVVLIPKTGSRISWTRPPQEPGEETIMVRIGQSTGFTEYFQRPPDRPECVRATDIAQAFSALGVPLSVPDPEEMAAEGFVITAAGTLIGTPTPTPTDSAGRLRKTGLALFGGTRRRAAQPHTAFPGPVGGGAYEQAERADAVLNPVASGLPEERAVHGTAVSYPADREPASGGTDALPDASDDRVHMAPAPRHDHSDASMSRFGARGATEFDGSDTDADVVGSNSAGRSAAPGRPGAQENTEIPGESGSGRPSAPVSEVFSPQDCSAKDPADGVVAGRRTGKAVRQSDARRGAAARASRSLPEAKPLSYSPLRSAERVSDRTSRSAAADTRSGRTTSAVWMRGLRGRLLRTAVGGAEDAPRPSVSSTSLNGEASAEKLRTGGEERPVGVTIGGPAQQPAPGTPGHGARGFTQVAVGVRRRLTGIRQAPVSRRERRTVACSAGSPWLPGHPQPGHGLRASGRPGSGQPVPGAVAGNTGENAGGGRGARYAAAVGAAAAVLAVVAGTVFAASGFARFEVAEYGAVCHGGGGTTVAAPYTASGSSPVHLAGGLSEITAFGPSAVWHPVDARSVQLVACVSEGRLGDLVRTCQYSPAPGHPVGRTLNLFAMAYRLDVYEARTGNRLAALDLTGEQFASDPASTEPDRCRAAAGAPEEGLPGRRHSRLSHQQIQRALAPFVTPAAPHIQAAR
ncbi:hypothetical protein [Nocardia flavorosea]|uniref:Nuclease-like protein n=1 Tax=Nocardia flavorosea TaxID=53429 RepID=A0A846YJB8_9NOCA|nr:hypothetical protein [Nocardia flavorosea]NKY57734.1 hypothetical protein [Nocardia flavorosea]